MFGRVKFPQIILFTAIFVVIQFILLSQDITWFWIVPIALMVVFIAFFSLRTLLWIVVFCTPFSFNIEHMDIGDFGMFLPTEPLLFGVLLLSFVKLLSGDRIDVLIRNHIITKVIIFYLLWMLFTAVTSQMPLVSFKFLLAKLWYIVSFYMIGASLFKNLKNIHQFIWLYIIPLTIVILITTYKHSLSFFDLQSSHIVMYPFFKDHTLYGAAIAFLIPLVVYLLFNSNYKWILIGILSVLLLGLVLSFSRAAWISISGAAAFAFVLKFRITFLKLISVLFFAGIVLFFGWDNIMMQLEKNTQDSSSSISKHVESVSNISTDASNLERINRWNCAVRMFKEKPFVGWGPGTYAFQYAPFQRAKERTIISTNQGDLGNAHSEFLGPLAESGLLGMLSFIALVLVVYYKGMQLYYNLVNSQLKQLVFFCLLSLTTYFIHSILNNFLDTDKLSVPFWSCICILMVVDIYQKELITEAE